MVLPSRDDLYLRELEGLHRGHYVNHGHGDVNHRHHNVHHHVLGHDNDDHHVLSNSDHHAKHDRSDNDDGHYVHSYGRVGVYKYKRKFCRGDLRAELLERSL